MKDLYPRQEGRDLKSKDPNKKVQSNWPFCLALTLFIMWVELIFLPEHATALGCNTMWHTCLNQLSQGTCKTWACTSLFTEHGLSFLPALFLSLRLSPSLFFFPSRLLLYFPSSSGCNMLLKALWEEISPLWLCPNSPILLETTCWPQAAKRVQH